MKRRKTYKNFPELYISHIPVQSLSLHTLSFLRHGWKTQRLSDASRFNSFHYNYPSFVLQIHCIKKRGPSHFIFSKM